MKKKLVIAVIYSIYRYVLIFKGRRRYFYRYIAIIICFSYSSNLIGTNCLILALESVKLSTEGILKTGIPAKIIFFDGKHATFVCNKHAKNTHTCCTIFCKKNKTKMSRNGSWWMKNQHKLVQTNPLFEINSW